MKILLSEYDVAKAIASFYKVNETYVKTDDEGYFQIDLPVETQITPLAESIAKKEKVSLSTVRKLVKHLILKKS